MIQLATLGVTKWALLLDKDHETGCFFTISVVKFQMSVDLTRFLISPDAPSILASFDDLTFQDSLQDRCHVVHTILIVNRASAQVTRILDLVTVCELADPSVIS